MQKHELEIAARLTALEYVVTEMGCAVYAALGADVERLREVASARFEQWTIPGLKEGCSDHLAAETQDAVDVLLRRIQTALDHAKQSST